MPRKSNKPEQPRVEPEIIPPDRSRQGMDWRQPTSQSTWRPYGPGDAGMGGAYQIHVGRIGPFGLAMLALATAILAAAIVFAVIGAVLFWIPIIALVIVAAAIFRFLRR
jgi:hypothetical protein